MKNLIGSKQLLIYGMTSNLAQALRTILSTFFTIERDRIGH